jgi:hypothetical protein
MTERPAEPATEAEPAVEVEEEQLR